MASSSTSDTKMHPLAQQYDDEYRAWRETKGQKVGMFPGYREWGFNQALKLYDELQNLKKSLGLDRPLFPKEGFAGGSSYLNERSDNQQKIAPCRLS